MNKDRNSGGRLERVNTQSPLGVEARAPKQCRESTVTLCGFQLPEVTALIMESHRSINTLKNEVNVVTGVWSNDFQPGVGASHFYIYLFESMWGSKMYLENNK